MSAAGTPRGVLLTGATGAVGGRLLPDLLARGHAVTCLVRDPARARLPDTVRVVRGDVLTGAGLSEALAGNPIAYYLIHSMGHAGRAWTLKCFDWDSLARQASDLFARVDE